MHPARSQSHNRTAQSPPLQATVHRQRRVQRSECGDESMLRSVQRRNRACSSSFLEKHASSVGGVRPGPSAPGRREHVRHGAEPDVPHRPIVALEDLV